MLGRYRCILIAAFGFLTAAASPEGRNVSGEQANAQRQIAERLHDLDTTVKRANDTGELNRPCESEKPNRNSQLCAQWESADAGKASATWGERTFWIGVGGGFVGLCALIAAAAAALFAKEAVKETRRIGEAQTKAYLSIAQVRMEFEDEIFPVFTIKLYNSGQSPARNIIAMCRCDFGENASIPGEFKFTQGEVEIGAGKREWLSPLHFPEEFEIPTNHAMVFFNIVLTYEDVFGNKEVSQHVLSQGITPDTLDKTYRLLPVRDMSAMVGIELARREQRKKHGLDS